MTFIKYPSDKWLLNKMYSRPWKILKYKSNIIWFFWIRFSSKDDFFRGFDSVFDDARSIHHIIELAIHTGIYKDKNISKDALFEYVSEMNMLIDRMDKIYDSIKDSKCTADQQKLYREEYVVFQKIHFLYRALSKYVHTGEVFDFESDCCGE